MARGVDHFEKEAGMGLLSASHLDQGLWPELKLDHRIGGKPIYYFASDRSQLVKVPDEVRKCVAFLAYRGAQEMRLAGTVFFVGKPIPNTTYSFLYAVTAKHVIEAIKTHTKDQRVYLRLNFQDSDAQLVYTNIDEWHFHPTDASVDVAVIPITFSANVDHLIYPIESLATDALIERERIGIGEEVFLTGLFVPHRGIKRNIPIIRVGNIAAMPEEPVNTRWCPTGIEAYLIEARSIGGLSGSPVFAHLGIVRHVEGKTRFAASQEGIFYLLGLMHGHWDMPIPDIDDIIDRNALDETSFKSVNMGIAIVVPAKKILEVINQPKLEEMEKRTETQIRQQSAATPDI